MQSKEKGQALTEYTVLFPGAILVAVIGFIIFGNSVKDLFRRSINEILDVTTEDVYVCVDEIITQDGGSYCEQSEFCDHIEPGDNPACGDFNSCNFGLDWNPGVVVIKAGQEYHIHIEETDEMYSYTTPDGCYNVSYNGLGSTIVWSKVGSGPDCQDVSHVQAWQIDNVVCE